MQHRRTDPRVKAIDLLGRWTRLAQGHVPFGAGCSCGANLTIRIADLERDLLDYLGHRHALAKRSATLAELLKSIAGGVENADELLQDLERSLSSFEELHR